MNRDLFNITDHFFKAAETYPDKAAIIHKHKRITFSELKEEVCATTAYLTSKGIAKGDRVMLFIPMGMDLYRIVLALFRMGATAVFLDEWVNRTRMDECCKVAQCKAFIGIPKARLLALLSAEIRKIPIRLGPTLPKGFTGKTETPETTGSDTALITFTTGSTGTPKAAKRTHAFLHAQFGALLDTINPQPDDIDMPVLPIVLLINLGAGCTSVISSFKASKPEAMNAEAILNQINELGVTRMVSSPFFVKQLAKHIELKGARNLPALKNIFTGGAPVFPSEAALYIKAFPKTKIEIVYGSTEAEPISSIDARELVQEMNHPLPGGLKVGIPYHKVRVRIIGIQTNPIHYATETELDKRTLPFLQIGEIIVSGEHVLTEYFNNESALKQNKIFIGETCWHRTGDSGYLDKDGVLYLTGRCNTLIYRDGKILAPFIYENFFQNIPGVESGTILESNSTLFALLEIKKTGNKAEIIQEANRTGLKGLEIRFITSIPRDSRHHSKIDYSRLRLISGL
ncbi:MAG TPA: AMP-binding protein [Bacteroidia bacterium]|jgi:acyl-CoA synthetase (AMP-forming)/AMP-acid ligase II|nr:AMP-binding protein [Bacteroidia bacterium]